jgi:hypothetical protein
LSDIPTNKHIDESLMVIEYVPIKLEINYTAQSLNASLIPSIFSASEDHTVNISLIN